ncbi:MAG: ATPase domain-containing protein [Archaeoglobaceae archaeon]
MTDQVVTESTDMKRFPTKIDFLDEKIEGFYPGFVILHGVVGAGSTEFGLTFLMNNSDSDEQVKLYYIAIAKTKEEVLREIRLVFPQEKNKRLIENLNVITLAEDYFKGSIVPLRWVSKRKLTINELKSGKDILTSLAETIEQCEERSIILMDSITDLARIARERIKWNDLVDLINGLKKICVNKEILMMSLLTSDALEKEKEEELMDQGDGVLIFEWSMKEDSVERWLYFRKFTGILPLLEREGILKYNVSIDPELGFTISNTVRVI